MRELKGFCFLTSSCGAVSRPSSGIMFEGSGNRQQKERPGWGKRLKFLTQKIDMGNFAMLFELERQVEAGFSISCS